MAQALEATIGTAAFGFAVRAVGGAFDPELFGTWAVVLAAPAVGVMSFLRSTRRDAMLSTLMLWGGVGALLFWTLMVASGRLAIASRAEALYAFMILAFPIGCIVVALRDRRRAHASAPTR